MQFQTSATAAAPAAEPQPRNLDFYRVRDDVIRAYQPATEEERLLVTQIARTWLRLQRLYDAESILLEQQPLADLFTADQDRFKTLHRAVAEAERMWRNAVEMFRQARRRRETGAPASTRRLSAVTVTSIRPAQAPLIAEPASKRTQSPTEQPPSPPETKRTQSAAPATCSPASTPVLQSVEKRDTTPVNKPKGGLN